MRHRGQDFYEIIIIVIVIDGGDYVKGVNEMKLTIQRNLIELRVREGNAI